LKGETTEEERETGSRISAVHTHTHTFATRQLYLDLVLIYFSADGLPLSLPSPSLSNLISKVEVFTSRAPSRTILRHASAESAVVVSLYHPSVPSVSFFFAIHFIATSVNGVKCIVPSWLTGIAFRARFSPFCESSALVLPPCALLPSLSSSFTLTSSSFPSSLSTSS